MDCSNFKIIHIDDDRSDTDLVYRVFKKIDYNGGLEHFYRGEDFLEYMKLVVANKDRLPNLIFLDIALPGANGKEILKILKNDPYLNRIPVIMLSGSNSEIDLHESMSIGASGYLLKTSDLNSFMESCKYFIYSWVLVSKQLFI